MLDILLWIVVGMFIGWNFPQPLYAKLLQEKIVAWIKRNEHEKRD